MRGWIGADIPASVAGTGLLAMSQARGSSPFESIIDERTDNKGRRHEQQQIPNCPER